MAPTSMVVVCGIVASTAEKGGGADWRMPLLRGPNTPKMPLLRDMSSIAAFCRYIGSKRCQAILMPLNRTFRYFGRRYIGPPTVSYLEDWPLGILTEKGVFRTPVNNKNRRREFSFLLIGGKKMRLNSCLHSVPKFTAPKYVYQMRTPVHPRVYSAVINATPRRGVAALVK